jgi:hypothetical protein
VVKVDVRVEIITVCALIITDITVDCARFILESHARCVDISTLILMPLKLPGRLKDSIAILTTLKVLCSCKNFYSILFDDLL